MKIIVNTAGSPATLKVNKLAKAVKVSHRKPKLKPTFSGISVIGSPLTAKPKLLANNDTIKSYIITPIIVFVLFTTITNLKFSTSKYQ